MSDDVVATLVPILSLRDAAQAIDFYRRAFGARELSRSTTPEGRIVAFLAIGESEFGVVDEAERVGNLSPRTLGGTSVRMSLQVSDPDAVAQRAVDAGAQVLFPVEDQPYGMRQGRVEDPFGHHWLIGRPIADTPASG
jgi:PhnB protein